MSDQVLLIKPLIEGAKAPVRGTAYAAGYDVYSTCSCAIEKDVVTEIRIGFAMAIPKGCYAKFEARSSLAREGVVVLGGVIDSDYRGEVIVLLSKITPGTYGIAKGNKIAQFIILKCETPEVVTVNELPQSERGEGGFGSTGKQ
jgi:deoxyuridine 5''-triphosphate nucleotidohydrolase (dut)